MRDLLMQAYIKVADDLDLNVDDVKEVYMSMWKFQREIIYNDDLFDPDDERKIFSVPNLGKFVLNLKRIRSVNRKQKREKNGKRKNQVIN